MTRRDVRLLGLALTLGLALLLWWWDPMANAPRHPPQPPQPPAAGSYADDVVRFKDLVPLTRSAPPAAANCTPHDELACNEGDVYWFDSCGNATEQFESCDHRGCEDARCLEPDAPPSDCGPTSAYGECSGSVAAACIQGRLVRVDCATYKQRCVMTSEGAACLPQDPKNGCDGDEPPRCEGERFLKVCADGVFRRIDCGARHAHCVERGALTQCELEPNITLPPLALGGGEYCDNIDNDLDGVVDEGDVCSEVPLVAFIPEGAELASFELRMQSELAILNRVYAPTRFRWARTRTTSSSYRKFDPKDMESAADALSQSESAFNQSRSNQADGAGLDFYVPVLYTEDLNVRPAKSGMSTLPNGYCGSVRLSDQPSPISGLIVLSESRQPETLAHEMGHYLGLCHTHEQLGQYVVASDALSECQRTGDAVCDTPVDPGPPGCSAVEGCLLMCRDASQPDPFNIMSYYIGCRRALSQEQLAIAARTLELRRGWFRCQDPHNCRCDPGLKLACPAEMSCRPSGGAADSPWYCQLDGANQPGTSCDDSALCSNRSFCAGSAQSGNRCIRPCNEEPGCSCIDVGLGVGICRQDLGI